MDGPERSLCILVVDDDPTVCHVLEFALSSYGHHVRLTSNGTDALHALREGHFDLVISDLRMPEVRGDQLACAIKALVPRLPIIILTGNLELLDSSTPAIDAVLEKPFPLDTLRQLVKRVARTSADS